MTLGATFDGRDSECFVRSVRCIEWDTCLAALCDLTLKITHNTVIWHSRLPTIWCSLYQEVSKSTGIWEKQRATSGEKKQNKTQCLLQENRCNNHVYVYMYTYIMKLYVYISILWNYITYDYVTLYNIYIQIINLSSHLLKFYNYNNNMTILLHVTNIEFY